MTRSSLAALAALSLTLSACVTPPPQAPSSQPALPAQPTGQLELSLASGTYTCEQGIKVQVRREVRDRVNHRVHIGWNGSSYRLERDPSGSGLPRFEDSASGLVWIDLPWKGLLLDGKTNKPLANDCRSSI